MPFDCLSDNKEKIHFCYTVFIKGPENKVYKLQKNKHFFVSDKIKIYLWVFWFLIIKYETCMRANLRSSSSLCLLYSTSFSNSRFLTFGTPLPSPPATVYTSLLLYSSVTEMTEGCGERLIWWVMLIYQFPPGSQCFVTSPYTVYTLSYPELKYRLLLFPTV